MLTHQNESLPRRRMAVWNACDPRKLQVCALIEVTPLPEGGAPAELLATCYRASRAGVIVLLLRGLDRYVADAALNPVVARCGLEVYGVIYLDEDEEDLALEVALRTPLVVASTERFSELLTGRAIAHQRGVGAPVQTLSLYLDPLPAAPRVASPGA